MGAWTTPSQYAERTEDCNPSYPLVTADDSARTGKNGESTKNCLTDDTGNVDKGQ